MDILRIATSGSVDDGKSTLIGRLLYETGQVPTDRMQQIEESSKRRGLSFTDLSLLTDGLISEREQGITIDVAHIYFHTPARKYIIADTPGHEEYTRNMVTGASQSEVAITLIDARYGMLEQTRRHLHIAHLLKMSNLIVAINKMDLVGYERSAFEAIKSEVESYVNQLGASFTLHFIPMSALHGEGVTAFKDGLSWYQGAPLLDILESIKPRNIINAEGQTNFQVQQVLRPRGGDDPDFRGYAGSLRTGSIRVGDEIQVLSTGKSSTVVGVHKWGTELNASGPDQALTVLLADDIDLRRGDALIAKENDLATSRRMTASICWMDEQPMTSRKKYIYQQGSFSTKIMVDQIQGTVNLKNGELKSNHQVLLNEIAKATFKSASAIPAIQYQEGNSTGAFALIDEQSLNTVAVGFAERFA